jgi:TolA-binding protein
MLPSVPSGQRPSEDRSVFDGLSKDDQDAFLAGDATVLEKARKKAMPEDDEDEEVAMSDELKKRFDDVQKKLDEANAKIQKAEELASQERDRREELEFVRKAETDLCHLPGDNVEKGKVLRVISKLDPAALGELTKLLAAGNEALKQLNQPVGKDSRGETATGRAYVTIEKKAKELAAEKRISFEKAFDHVMSSDPELYEQYLQEQVK